MDKTEVQEIAIEFAKYLMETKVARCRSGSLDKIELEQYTPYEYDLMRGNLIQNGNNMFHEFMNDYYAG